MIWKKVKSTLKQPKFGLFTNLFNKLLRPRNLIILIGDYGMTITVFKYNNIIDSVFIPIEKSAKDAQKYDFTSYQRFLDKHKAANIFFLTANSEHTIKHEVIPILPSIAGTNPIKHFISENFDTRDIVAYNVYNIAHKEHEELHTIFASTQYTPLLSSMLGYVLAKKLRFAGFYFLSLEIRTIIDNLLRITGNAAYNNHLQICVTILKCSGIKIAVKHKKNILSSKFVPYHPEKSMLYLAGQIEEEINNYLIFFKNYVKRFNLETCAVFMLPISLKEPLLQIKLNTSQSIYLARSRVSKEQGHANNNWSKDPCTDIQITGLFNKNKSFLGLNSSLQTIMQINFLEFMVFKPLLAVTVILLCITISLKANIILGHYKKDAIDKEYYKIARQYHKIKEWYPNIYETINPADIYFFEKLLERRVQTPFEMLEEFLLNSGKNIHIHNVSWHLSDTEKLLSIHNIKLRATLKLTSDSPSIEKATKELDGYMSTLQNAFKGWSISLTKSTRAIIKTTDRVIIPVEVVIDKNI